MPDTAPPVVSPVRAAPFPSGDDIRARIDALGDVALDRATRHAAFADLYAALTPPGFRLMPWPDETQITTAAHDIKLSAVLVDEAVNGQVAARIERHVVLDGGFVSHDLLQVQKPYRGSGFSHVLLNQAFPFYRALGLRAVVVHAALETGR
jgi:GNAT superfamily N-acetyltransferase